MKNSNDKDLIIFGPYGQGSLWIVHYGVLRFMIKKVNRYRYDIYMKNITGCYDTIGKDIAAQRIALTFIRQTYKRAV